MGFWSELTKANPHKSVKRGDELGAANIIDIVPIHDSSEANATQHEANTSYIHPQTGREMLNGFLVCSVCRIAIGDFGNKNTQAFAVTIDEATPLSFADTNDVTVCSGCIEVFNVG